jgi:hypothetical protein
MNTKKPSVFSKYEHIKYLSYTKRWFGPLKKATVAISKSTVSPFTEQAYLEYIKKKYPVIFSHISTVVFYLFDDLSAPKKLPIDRLFTIAVTHTYPEPTTRQKLYDEREQITLETGWYPLVMGERAKINVPTWKLSRLKQDLHEQIQNAEIGQFQRIRSFNSQTLGGSAFLLEGSNGCVVFDAGFGLQDKLPSNTKAIYISHFHADHIGGIEDCLNNKTTIFMSELTLRSAILKLSRNPKNLERLLGNTLATERVQPLLDENSPFQVFPVFHAPGSYGFALNDNTGNGVIYPGDLCLRNGFLDYSQNFIKTIERFSDKKSWVLVDATMVSRDIDSIDKEDTPKNVIKEMTGELSKRNVVFVSQSTESLMYEYISAFLATRSLLDEKSVKFVLNKRLLELCGTLLAPMVTRHADQMDLFIDKVIGRSITNFIESHRVYPMDALGKIDLDEKVILFTTPDEIGRNSVLQKRLQGSFVVLAGTLAIRPDEYPIEVTNARPRSILNVSSPDWNFHSDETDLANLVKEFTKLGINSLLFHSRRENLEKFIKNYSLNPKYVSVIDYRGISLT